MRILLVYLFLSGLIMGDVIAQQEPASIHLSLKQAIGLASKQNAQVLAANQRVLQALANISANNAAMMPQISGVFGGQRKTMDLRSSGINIPGDPHVGPFNSFDTRGKLTLDIFDPEAVGRIKSAKASSRLTQAQEVKVKQDMLALVGAMFLEAKRADQSVGLNEITLRESQKYLEIVQNRHQQGIASAVELNQAKANLASVEYSYQAAVVRAAQTRLDLASALKISLDQPIIFEEDQQWVDSQLQQSEETPEEAVAQAQLEQSKAQEREIKRSVLPKVTMAGDLGRQGRSFDESSNTYSVGVQVSVPVWEGGSKQAKIAQANAKIKEDEIMLVDAQDQAQIKIRLALENLTKSKALLKAKIEQLNTATAQLEVDRNRLKTGLGDVLDAYRSESLKALALDDKNEAQAVYWTAKINLAHAMGKVEDMFSAKGGPTSGGE